MKAILREDKTGVSEVLGTILILGMTVTLFSVIIVWVSSIPSPTAQTRVDLTSQMTTIPGGATGVQIILTHRGGQALYPVPTVIYVSRQVGSGPQTTDTVSLHLFNPVLLSPSGLIDGSDSIWSIGERWEYENLGWSVSDSITVTIVDTSVNAVVWSGEMNPNQGSKPPIFISVWTSGAQNGGQPSPVYAQNGFFVYAEVISPITGGFIRPNSVYLNITPLSQSGACLPFPMSDDGQAPDIAAGDNIWSAGSNGCMGPPYPAQSWTGWYLILNATDNFGNKATTRFVLNILPNPTTIQNTQTIPSQLWQYIGFVQIRTGEVWLTNLTLPYSTTNTFQPFRVLKTWMNAGVIFHFKMANHGNTTIFIDGFTEAFFTNTQSPGSSQVMFITAPCSTSINANAGGITAYPGTVALNTFTYATYGPGGNMGGCQSTTPAGVFDINPLNQEIGGTPYTVMVFTGAPFTQPSAPNWPAPGSLKMTTYFINILVAGMSGPVNYTYAMLLNQTGSPNPFSCTGLGPNYNPINHLLDANPKCRTNWYAQVVPFNAMIMFG